MIKLENTEVMGWEHAIRGMRNPMNSWAKSDSFFCTSQDGCDNCPMFDEPTCPGQTYFEARDQRIAGDIGDADRQLMMGLANGGPVHAKYRRMITVYLDITAPLYWWKEFDTYKVGTVANSCSTMHKIHEKEFTLEDFSREHLISNSPIPGRVYSAKQMLEATIQNLNIFREEYLNLLNINEEAWKTVPKAHGLTDESLSKARKLVWWQMIQLLPSSYNQKRTVMLNYEVLTAMYESRKNHKLDEWRECCKWIEKLPYSEIITGEKEE